ncbi:MAG: hypothetical protein R2827_07530 [Bdellovibrionales bacterium]
MLVGRPPFKSKNRIEVLKKIDGEDIAFPERVNGKIPPRVKQIIMRMCERSLQLRYKSVDEIKADLLDWKNNPDKYTRPEIKTSDFENSVSDPLVTGIHDMSAKRKSKSPVTDPSHVRLPDYSDFEGFGEAPAASFINKSIFNDSKTLALIGLVILAVAVGLLLSSGNESTDIQDSESSSIVSEINPTQLISPAEGQLIESNVSDTSKPTRVDFEWISAVDSSEYKIEVATDKSFSNVVYMNITQGRSTPNVPLKPGAYFWRVITTDPETSRHSSTEIQSFEVVAKRVVFSEKEDETAPTVEVEKDSSNNTAPSRVVIKAEPPKPRQFLKAKPYKLPSPYITSGQGSAIVGEDSIISWSPISKADYYEFEISKHPNFYGTSAYKMNTRSNKVAWTPRETGNFYYRVKAIDKGGAHSDFSKPSSIRVSSIQPRLKVKRSYDVSVSNPRSLASVQSIPILWETIPNAAGYNILVSRDKSFRKILKQQRSRTNRANITVPSETPVYIKVAAINNKGQVFGDYSTPSRTTINLNLDISAPQLVSPQNAVRIPPTQKNTMFEWSPPQYAKAYEIQFARDRKFNSIIDTYSTLVPKYLRKNPWQVGKYYWRVRAKHDKHTSDWSNPGIFFIKN